jgi:hypothetical protein
MELKMDKERYVCTKDNPWDQSKGTPAQHPDAVDDGECWEGCCDYYKFPNCGLRFRVELAQ